MLSSWPFFMLALPVRYMSLYGPPLEEIGSPLSGLLPPEVRECRSGRIRSPYFWVERLTDFGVSSPFKGHAEKEQFLGVRASCVTYSYARCGSIDAGFFLPLPRCQLTNKQEQIDRS